MVAVSVLGCMFSCKDELILDSMSPKGPQTVRVLVRNCGATTPYVTIVQAGAGSRWVDVAVLAGRPVVDVRWPSVQSVVIAYGQCSPGDVRMEAGGIPGVTVQLVADPLLTGQCAPTGAWEPSPIPVHK